MSTDFRALCAELLDEVAARPLILDRELIARARAALAEPVGEPAPPAAGEVGELVAWLRRSAGCADESPMDLRAAYLLSIAYATGPELWEPIAQLPRQRHPAPVPVAVSERLPEPSVKVLAHYLNDLGKGRTICAIWVPAKTRSDSYGDDDFTEYDEELDTFYWPEGWYEAIENWDDLGYVKVDQGEVIYWQSLPTWPAHALPLPSGEVK